MKLFAISAAIAAVCAWAAPAEAQPAAPIEDPSLIIGILDLQVDGVSATAAARFETSIEEGLTGSGYQVSPRKRLMALLGQSSYVPGCLFGPCLEEVFRNTELRLVLVARITSVGPSYEYVVSLLDTRIGRPTSQVTDQCEVCTLEEAIASTTLAVIELVTGSGNSVVDPALGPVGKDELPDLRGQLEASQREVGARQRRLRRAALFFIGAAALAGGAGAYFLSRDQTDRGYPAVAVGGAFAIASGTLLVLSRRF